MYKKCLAIFLCIMMILTMLPTVLLAQDNTVGQQKYNGELIISVLQNDQWNEVGGLPFDRFYSEQKIDLNNLIHSDGLLKIRITQRGGGSTQLDYVALGDSAPISVNEDTGLLLKKISKEDFDVFNIKPSGVVLAIEAKKTYNILTVAGRIES